MFKFLSLSLLGVISLLLVSCGSSSNREPDLDAPTNLQGLVLTFRLDNGETMVLDTGTGSQLTWNNEKFNGSFTYHQNFDSDRDTAILRYISLTAGHSFQLNLDLIFHEADYSGLDISRVSGGIRAWSYEYKKTRITEETVIARGGGNGGSFEGH